ERRPARACPQSASAMSAVRLRTVTRRIRTIATAFSPPSLVADSPCVAGAAGAITRKGQRETSGSLGRVNLARPHDADTSPVAITAASAPAPALEGSGEQVLIEDARARAARRLHGREL